MRYNKEEIAKSIDHTFLNSDGRLADIRKLCAEAKEYNFASVAIAPYFVELASQELKNTDIKVDVAIGFPLGYTTTKIKVEETKDAINKGATEVDMMVNVSAVKDGRWDYVKKDIAAVAEQTNKMICKVIFETCYLNNDEIVKLAEICMDIDGVDYIKTSTGFGPAGARIEDVKLMKQTVGDRLCVKASGGIRTLEDYLKMREAGATRIGSSSGVKIVNEI